MFHQVYYSFSFSLHSSADWVHWAIPPLIRIINIPASFTLPLAIHFLFAPAPATVYWESLIPPAPAHFYGAAAPAWPIFLPHDRGMSVLSYLMWHQDDCGGVLSIVPNPAYVGQD